MVGKSRVFIFLLLIVTAWTAPAVEKSVIKKKQQTLSFEDELVEGETQKPELFYLFQRKNFNYKRLFKLRENFIPEARRNAEDIKPRRSTP